MKEGLSVFGRNGTEDGGRILGRMKKNAPHTYQVRGRVPLGRRPLPGDDRSRLGALLRDLGAVPRGLGAVVGSIARLNVDTKTPEAARIFALRDLIELAEYLVENGGTNAEHAVLELREIAEGVRHG